MAVCRDVGGLRLASGSILKEHTPHLNRHTPGRAAENPSASRRLFLSSAAVPRRAHNPFN